MLSLLLLMRTISLAMEAIQESIEDAAEALLSLTDLSTYNSIVVESHKQPTSGPCKPGAKGSSKAKAPPASKLAYATRSYIWRGPHRDALALCKRQRLAAGPAAAATWLAAPACPQGWSAQEQLQQLQQAQQQEQQEQQSDTHSSRRSSASGAHGEESEVVQHGNIADGQQPLAPQLMAAGAALQQLNHPDDKVAELQITQHQQLQRRRDEQRRRKQAQRQAERNVRQRVHTQQQLLQAEFASAEAVAGRQRDKEWAALTTWIRMNLHNPRTAKKLVLFVGAQQTYAGSWGFVLNPGLTWDDVSLETRLRLRTLPLEAEQAYANKYPGRPVGEWADKIARYRPPGSERAYDVPLGDLVMSLHALYYQHEPCEQQQHLQLGDAEVQTLLLQQQHLQQQLKQTQQQQQQHCTGDLRCGAAQQEAHDMHNNNHHHQQQQQQEAFGREQQADASDAAGNKDAAAAPPCRVHPTKLERAVESILAHHASVSVAQLQLQLPHAGPARPCAATHQQGAVTQHGAAAADQPPLCADSCGADSCAESEATPFAPCSSSGAGGADGSGVTDEIAA